jgi:hypothetical protein
MLPLHRIALEPLRYEIRLTPSHLGGRWAESRLIWEARLSDPNAKDETGSGRRLALSRVGIGEPVSVREACARMWTAPGSHGQPP